MTRPVAFRTTLIRRSLLSIFVVTMVIGCACASASASQPDIEGVWSFSGGSVIVAPNQAGQLVGTVASPTVFASCVHPVGQAMWTDLQPKANGMYTGFHQWYHIAGTNCTEMPELGPTAFRVITESDGSQYLSVCFNRPGTTMPSIAPDGTPSNVNVGCTESAPVSGIPTASPTFYKTITLPPTGSTVCLSQRRFSIHIQEPRRDPFVRLTVYLGARVFKVVRRGEKIRAVVNLRGLPKGTYTIKIRARTAAGYLVEGSRTYHTCVPRIPKA